MSSIVVAGDTSGLITLQAPAIANPADTIEACMKDIPEGAVYEIVDTDTVPSDRTFRDAWTWA